MLVINHTMNCYSWNDTAEAPVYGTGLSGAFKCL